MKIQALCGLSLSLAFFAGCDQPNDGGFENLEDFETQSFRHSTDSCVKIKTASIRFTKKITPNPEERTVPEINFGFQAAMANTHRALAGTVPYMLNADSVCETSCAGAGLGGWTGEGCTAGGHLELSSVSFIETNAVSALSVEIAGESDLGCSCG